MKKSEVLLVDMDNITVDMVNRWMEIYNDLSGETIEEEDIVEYQFQNLVKDPKLLSQILYDEGFFYGLPPIRGAIKYLNKLIAEGYDIVFLTQSPRKSVFAESEKKEWLSERLRHFDKSNIIFAHRKELVQGAVLFDDKPGHLRKWKRNFPGGKTVTIDYLYNRDVKCDLRLNKTTAWKEFYDFVKANIKPTEHIRSSK